MTNLSQKESKSVNNSEKASTRNELIDRCNSVIDKKAGELDKALILLHDVKNGNCAKFELKPIKECLLYLNGTYDLSGLKRFLQPIVERYKVDIPARYSKLVSQKKLRKLDLINTHFYYDLMKVYESKTGKDYDTKLIKYGLKMPIGEVIRYVNLTDSLNYVISELDRLFSNSEGKKGISTLNFIDDLEGVFCEMKVLDSFLLDRW